jgi:hypothetical protein
MKLITYEYYFFEKIIDTLCGPKNNQLKTTYSTSYEKKLITANTNKNNFTLEKIGDFVHISAVQ